MSEVQGERNITVYSDMCLRYILREMLLCTLICASGPFEGNVTVYTDVCLRYRVREILISKMMCV